MTAAASALQQQASGGADVSGTSAIGAPAESDDDSGDHSATSCSSGEVYELEETGDEQVDDK